MIPKKIHYFWIGGNPKPESVLYCIDSWKKYCPDYEIIEWNESNYDFTKNEYMRQAYEAKKWGFVPDYARLDVIYQYGGIYLDTDVEIIRPLGSLLCNKAFMGIEKTTEKKHYVACGLGFGAEPGNSLIRRMMAEYDSISFYREDGTLNLLPSPQYNTKTMERYGFSFEDQDQMIEDVMVYASDVLCPKMYCSSEMHLTERTVSIHHYDGSWMDGNRKRLYNRNVRLNQLLGDHTGNKVAKALEDFEYLLQAVKRHLNKKTARY